MDLLETIAFSFMLLASLLITYWLFALRGYFALPYQKSPSPHIRLIDLLFCFGIIFLSLHMFLFPAFLLFLSHRLFPIGSPHLIPFILFGSSSLTLISLYLYSLSIERKSRLSIWKDTSFPGTRSLLSDSLQGLLTLFLSCMTVLFVGVALESLLKQLNIPLEGEQIAVQLLKQALSSPLSFICMVSIISFIAPVTEEFLFRGLLQNWLKPRLGTTLTCILTASAFSFIHFSPAQKNANFLLLPSLFIFGLFASFLYEKTRSLFAPIVLHVTFNSINVIRIIFN